MRFGTTTMSGPFGKRFGRVGGSIAASLALHALIFSLLFVHLPITLPEPEEEEAVAVEIVPPLEEASPEEEASLAEQVDQTEAAEPPANDEDQPEEAAAEPEEPAVPETEMEVASAPAEAVEEPLAQDQPSMAAPPAAEGEGRSMPFPALNPVFEYGERDQGPREALEGNSAEEGTDPAREADAPDQVETPADRSAADNASSDDTQADPRDTSQAPTPDEAEPTEEPLGEEEPAETALAEPSPADGSGPGIEILSGGTSDRGIAVGLPAPAEAGEVEAASSPQTEAPPLEETKELFSRAVTDDPRAVTAMAGIPRGVRADQLCITELREQLRRGSPPYQPELLPSYKLGEGTRFEIRDAAFRAGGRWYDLSYRCEINEEATKVLSFALRVGGPIPRGEWAARKLPAY